MRPRTGAQAYAEELVPWKPLNLDRFMDDITIKIIIIKPFEFKVSAPNASPEPRRSRLGRRELLSEPQILIKHE